MAVKMDGHLCGTVEDGKLYQGHNYTVTFSTEDQALAYIAPRLSTSVIAEREDSRIPKDWTRLLKLLYPTCEHGLSADLCYGPGHYAPDSVVDSWDLGPDPYHAGF